MRKWTGTVCILLGAALIISALLLLRYNRMEDEQAGEAAEAVVADLKDYLYKEEAQAETEPDKSESAVKQETEEIQSTFFDHEEENMAAVEAADGYEYIGFLTIPALKLELPVMSEWDYKRLKLAPCRQYGSAEGDDLIIAAHNYKRHFGNLSQLNDGDQVVFTDMEGNEYQYAVREIATLQPTEVDVVVNSDRELILYTCTYGGQSRIVVGCERVE